jgi:hypothetical protein
MFDRFRASAMSVLAFVCGSSFAAGQCDDLSLIARVARADAIFVGRVIASHEREIGLRVVRTYPTLVLRDWKGATPDTVELVESPIDDPLVPLRAGATLLVFGVDGADGLVRASHCLGSRTFDADDPELAALDYVAASGVTIFACEGGGVVIADEAYPSFGVSIEHGVVGPLLLRVRITQGPYRIESISPSTDGDVTGHAVALALGLRARVPARWLGALPYLDAGLARAFAVDGLAATTSIDHGLWSAHGGLGIDVPLGAQFGAFVEADVALALDGRAPRAFGARVGVQGALRRQVIDPESR